MESVTLAFKAAIDHTRADLKIFKCESWLILPMVLYFVDFSVFIPHYHVLEALHLHGENGENRRDQDHEECRHGRKSSNCTLVI